MSFHWRNVQQKCLTDLQAEIWKFYLPCKVTSAETESRAHNYAWRATPPPPPNGIHFLNGDDTEKNRYVLNANRTGPIELRRQTNLFTIKQPKRRVKMAALMLMLQSSGGVWKSRWPSWAPRPNEPYVFCGRKATLNHAHALVTACP